MKAFVIARSSDGINYEPYSFVQATAFSSGNQTQTYTVVDDVAAETALDPALAHRYWRFVFNQAPESDDWKIVGNIILRDAGGNDLTTGVATATASTTNGGQSASNLLDNDQSTYWEADGTEQFAPSTVTLDLGTAQIVDEYELQAWNGSATFSSGRQVPPGWKLQCSDDNANWSTVDWKVAQPGFAIGEVRTYPI